MINFGYESIFEFKRLNILVVDKCDAFTKYKEKSLIMCRQRKLIFNDEYYKQTENIVLFLSNARASKTKVHRTKTQLNSVRTTTVGACFIFL